ncbi:hypothetical protein Hanom_Chr07g00652821 [Helianthus anomalus]
MVLCATWKKVCAAVWDHTPSSPPSPVLHHARKSRRRRSFPVLRWDLGLFEQITRSFRFPPEWDARYPGQNQMVADALPGYITLFEDFFHQGNFRLPATNFMAHILQFYGFHISQMSPPGMSFTN